MGNKDKEKGLDRKI